MGGEKARVCLELKKISVNLNRQPVLREIDLKIFEGEIVSVIGPNGAGKTTLFNVITGQIQPNGGSLWYRDRNITGWPPHRICHAGIAHTFQIARPFPEMTALENVLIGLWFGKRTAISARGLEDKARELLDLVGIARRADSKAGELTLSEQRRLEVARALSTQPDLLLLDEIAAGLSPQAVNQAIGLIRTLRTRGLTLLVIDHFLNLTAKVSDRIIALDQGETIVSGKPAEVIHHPEVASAYLGERQVRDGRVDE